jgi:undecaprenyl-diphosphatase
LSGRLQAAATRAPWLRRAAIPLARSGDSWLWLIVIAAGTLVVGPSAYPVAARLTSAIVAAALLVKGCKLLARRARPEGDWGGSYRRSDPHAFPSGHSTRAFMLAVLGFAYGPAWLGPLLVVWAVLVAASRVALGVHYLLDVTAGAVLGLACGLVVLLI